MERRDPCEAFHAINATRKRTIPAGVPARLTVSAESPLLSDSLGSLLCCPAIAGRRYVCLGSLTRVGYIGSVNKQNAGNRWTSSVSWYAGRHSIARVLA